MSTTFIETVVQGSTQVDFPVTFTYITESDVKVYVDGVITTGYTFTSEGMITFTTPPTDGSTVLVRRETDAETKAVDFQSGAMLTEGDLDTAFDQVFNLAQETKDVAIHDFNEATDAFNAVKEYLPEINTIADDLGHGAITHIDFGDLTSTTATPASDSVIYNVYDNLADIEAVKDNKDNIDVVAGLTDDITALADLSTELERVGSVSNMEIITTAADPDNLATMSTAKVIVEQGVLDVITTNLNTLQNAGTYANQATTGATNAAASEAGAALEAAAALSHKDAASQSAWAANADAILSLTQAGISTTKATEASASAAAASTSASVANASEGVAATHASTASNSKTGAQLAESGATVSMNTAISETATATTKAGEASTSAANALVSEGAASVSAATATTKASEASASEGVATTKASEAAVALATFQDQYYGALATPPTTNLDVGDIYFDTVENSMKVYSGTAWGNVAPVALSLLVSQISDLTASASELNYVDATSSIQTQLDAKADSASISSFLVDATTSASGLMSGADKAKLDGMTFTTGSGFPAVGVAGSLFFNTSDGALYLSTGSIWSHAAPSSATFTHSGSTLTITS